MLRALQRCCGAGECRCRCERLLGLYVSTIITSALQHVRNTVCSFALVPVGWRQSKVLSLLPPRIAGSTRMTLWRRLRCRYAWLYLRSAASRQDATAQTAQLPPVHLQKLTLDSHPAILRSCGDLPSPSWSLCSLSAKFGLAPALDCCLMAAMYVRTGRQAGNPGARAHGRPARLF